MAIKSAETIAIDMQVAFNSSNAVVDLETQFNDGLIAPLDFARKVMQLWEQFQLDIAFYL